MPYIVFGGEGFGAAEDDAVDDNEGDEEAEGFVEVGEVGLHDKLDDGDESCNHDDESGNAHLVRNKRFE